MYKHFVICVCAINYVMGPNIQDKTKNARVCVIGAGVAGLSSARYLKEEGINFTVLECTKYVGGTWRYDPRVGTDENGLPLHTSMYKHLRTNLPKPTMELNGFRLPDDVPSFPGREHYYEYLKRLAKYYDLEKHIQFLHLVVSVKRVDNVWKVKHKHVVTGEEFEEDYDYVLVGNGHHSKPNRPTNKGEDKFKGTIIHSHDYKMPEPYAHRRVLIIGAGPSGMEIGLLVAEVASRLVHSHHSAAKFDTTHFPSHYVKKTDVKEFNETGVIFVDGTFEDIDDVIYCTGTIIHSHDYKMPEPYAHRRVLIIGAGPSGMEIGLLVAEVASRLVHSHHSAGKFDTTHFPSHYVKKTDVKEFNETGVIFVDGTFEDIDDVIYCTGYQYDYPFLDGSSGLTLSPGSVGPLYKYMVNINEPTMVFMGLVVRACLVTAIDAQARYATALIKRNFTLPSKQAMMAEWQALADALIAKGRPMKDIHVLADKEDEYYAELTRESGIARVPPVIFKIRNTDMRAKLENLYTYRNYVYTVVDNDTFTRRLEDASITSNNTVM